MSKRNRGSREAQRAAKQAARRSSTRSGARSAREDQAKIAELKQKLHIDRPASDQARDR
jgi:hypothetical protein